MVFWRAENCLKPNSTLQRCYHEDKVKGPNPKRNEKKRMLLDIASSPQISRVPSHDSRLLISVYCAHYICIRLITSSVIDTYFEYRYDAGKISDI